MELVYIAHFSVHHSPESVHSPETLRSSTSLVTSQIAQRRKRETGMKPDNQPARMSVMHIQVPVPVPVAVSVSVDNG